jgi:hypothetical protein
VTARVKGAGHFPLKDPPGFVGDFKWIYRFTMQATQHEDGTDTGTVKFRSFQPPGQNDAGFPGEWTGEVSVNCVEVEGNTAWLTGPVVRARTDSPFGPSVGGIAMFIVRDNGAAAVDEIAVGPASIFGAETCRDRPPLPAGPPTDGNVIVESY